MTAFTLKRDADTAGIHLHGEDDPKRTKVDASCPDQDINTIAAEQVTAVDIIESLDLSRGNPVTPENAQERFSRIAEALVREHCIVCHDAAKGVREEYEILELEFYLNSEEHPDPYTHGSEEQTTLGQWYFHRAPRKTPLPKPTAGSKPAGYRGGTRKGLDITLGCPPGHTGKKMRGGILLRTIRRISDRHIISGPSLLVDELLRVTSASSLTDLVDSHWLGDISISSHLPGAKSWLTVVRTEKQESSEFIYHSPRIGLDLSHPSAQIDKANPRLRFVCAHYRFFVHPELLIANGRGQTFLGVALLAPKGLGCSDDEFVLRMPDRVGMQQATATKYLTTYRAARESKDLRDFIGPIGKGAGSSAVPFLQMAGAVRRYLDLEDPAPGQGEARRLLNLDAYAYTKTTDV